MRIRTKLWLLILLITGIGLLIKKFFPTLLFNDWFIISISLFISAIIAYIIPTKQ